MSVNFTDAQLVARRATAETLREQISKSRIINGELLDEVILTLTHAHKFIISRQKMHPDGVELYEEVIQRLEDIRDNGQSPNIF